MKILHISDHLPNYHKKWGGAEQVAYRYIKLLSESDHEIIVGGVKPEKTVEDTFKFLRILVIEDFFPERFQVYLTGLKNRIFSFDPIAFLHLLLILQKEKPEIVHFHKFNKISFSAILAAKLMGAKTILGIYDYWYLCPGGMLIDENGNLCRRFHGSWCANCNAVTDFRFLLPVISPFRRRIFDLFYRFVDIFAVLSEAQGKLLEEYGFPKEKISLIRQVFSFSQKRQFPTKVRRNVVLFAGWIDFRKGLHIIIEAMPKILENFPKAELWVLKLEAAKIYEKMIEDMIRRLKLSKKIKIYGRLSKEEFQELLQQANVVVVPEQWENMSPVIVVEAMANGKVVVASKMGGIPEFIKDGKNGFLATHNSPSSFAEKVVLALKNQDEVKRLGNKASEYIVKLCNQDKIKRDLLKLYKAI